MPDQPATDLRTWLESLDVEDKALRSARLLGSVWLVGQTVGALVDETEQSEAVDAHERVVRDSLARVEEQMVALAWERDRLQAVADKLIDAGVERWNTTVNDEPDLHSWLGLTWQEYKAWVEGGMPALAALGEQQEPRVTHGRHCTCSACAREDWTRITAPCGMHGASCPAVYAPIAVRSPWTEA